MVLVPISVGGRERRNGVRLWKKGAISLIF